MSTSEFISTAAHRLGDGALLGVRARAEVVRFLACAAADDGHIPEEPEARRCAVRIAGAMEQDRAEAARTGLARLSEVSDQQRKEVLRVTGDLVDVLCAMFPSAHALVIGEKKGRLMSARLISAAGRSVRELGSDADVLPPLPAHLRSRWPEGALARVKDLDDVVALLAASGLVFDDLPSGMRGEDDCSHSHIPVLFLKHGCEYGY